MDGRPPDLDEATMPVPGGQLERLWEAMWRVERELDLLKRTISGVWYWPVLRSRVADALGHSLGLFDPLYPQLRRFPPRRIASMALPLWGDRDLSPQAIAGSFDTIVVPFSRKHLQDGRPTDIYTSRVLREPELGRILILDRRARDVMPFAPDCVVRSRDHHVARALMGAVVSAPILLAEADHHRREIAAAFEKVLGIRLALSSAHMAFRVAMFSEGRRLARRFIARSGARRLLFAATRGGAAIAAAAQDCGIPTLEFQHGFIGRYHPAYDYPGRPFVPYAADALLLFGEYWENSGDLPSNTRTLVIGSPNITKLKSRLREKKARQVFVPSQGTIGKRLFDEISTAARLAPQWQFVFRPHPLEGWAHYQSQILPENLRLSPPHEDLYEIMATSEVQVGVYSTALFEGMALGVRTVVVALPGIENIIPTVARGDAVLAHDAAGIAACLAKAPLARHADVYYAQAVPSIAAITRRWEDEIWSNRRR